MLKKHNHLTTQNSRNSSKSQENNVKTVNFVYSEEPLPSDGGNGNGTQKKPLLKTNQVYLANALFRITPELRQSIPNEWPILTLNGVELMARDSLVGLNGDINAGKSPLLEILACMWIQPLCAKHHGFSDGLRMMPQSGKVLFVDTERGTQKLVHVVQSAWERRLQNESTRLLYYPLRHIKTKDRLAAIHYLLHTVPDIQFLVIDSLTQMVEDKNRLPEANACIDRLYAWIQEFDMPILASIHGNRNDSTGKATGNLGAVFQERSIVYLRLKYHPNDPDQRILTANFDNGKVRWGKKHDASAAFQWCSPGGFEEVEYIEPGGSHEIDINDKFSWLYHFIAKQGKPTTGIRQSDLQFYYAECHKVSSHPHTLNLIKKAVARGFLKRTEINPRHVEYDFCPEELLKDDGF